MTEERCVLVVDDDPTILATVSAFAGAAGFRPVTADDAATALALIDTGLAPVLVVTDLHMPGLDGTELIAALHERCAVTTIMYSSGNRPARNGGADLWLGKGNPVALAVALREFASAEQEAA
jgi:CheY-like chemotaxis protein